MNSFILLPMRLALSLFWALAAISMFAFALCCVGTGAHLATKAIQLFLDFAPLAFAKALIAAVAAYFIGLILAVVTWATGVLAWHEALHTAKRRAEHG